MPGALGTFADQGKLDFLRFCGLSYDYPACCSNYAVRTAAEYRQWTSGVKTLHAKRDQHHRSMQNHVMNYLLIG